MLYNTGTIAINGNTATGTGTNWTAPVSQVRAGQTIIVMSNPVQLFQISSVDSATSMTVTPAASPALSGQKYGILISDNISVDSLAQAMSQLIKEYDENIGAWETFATTSANQTITVTINGSSVNIPGIGALARKGANSDITELKGLTTALSIAQGGTGATKAEDARTNLGLGSSATKDVGTASGNVMQVGAGGFLVSTPTLIAENNSRYPSSFMRSGGGSGKIGFGSGIYCSYDDSICFHLHIQGNGELHYRYLNAGLITYDYVAYSTGNTTKASDGTLKAASPVARIVASQEACQRFDCRQPIEQHWCLIEMQQTANLLYIFWVDFLYLLRDNPAPWGLSFIIFKGEVLEFHPADIQQCLFQIEVITDVFHSSVGHRRS